MTAADLAEPAARHRLDPRRPLADEARYGAARAPGRSSAGSRPSASSDAPWAVRSSTSRRAAHWPLATADVLGVAVLVALRRRPVPAR